MLKLTLIISAVLLLAGCQGDTRTIVQTSMKDLTRCEIAQGSIMLTRRKNRCGLLARKLFMEDTNDH